MILSILTALVIGYAGWSFICLERNVYMAKKMKIPVVRIPIDGLNVPWVTFQPLVWAIVDRLPIPWSAYPAWFTCLRRGWHFKDANSLHSRLGPVWALASPVNVNVHFADPDATIEMYSRRQDFVRPIEDYRVLEVFGPCLSTAGWDDWPRHRKPLAAPFNESIMKFVWSETLNQSKQMAASWNSKGAQANGIASTGKDTRTLSLNVLAAIGFGQSYDFHGSSDGPADEKAANYRDALATVLDNCIILMLVPINWLKSPLTPPAWGKIGKAADSFMDYMRKMVLAEEAALKEGKSGTGAGIMTSFIHALHEHEAYQKIRDPSLPDIPKYRKGLCLNEVYSNLFIINFAGHDTTANTIAFALFCLAAHPDMQDWVAEEISATIHETPAEEWEYQELFPKLNRCRAVLYETLRVFPPVMILPKWTANKTQQITVAGQALTIPSKVNTSIYMRAIQVSPKYWQDPLTWNPTRWIVQSPDCKLGNEQFFQPAQGTYFPWSSGPQNCPGKKFAEVEFIALIAHLLRGHRISVKRYEGESQKAACQRAWVSTEDANADLLLRMNDPKHTKLVYTEVEKK